jgi:hypothetical protein
MSTIPVISKSAVLLNLICLLLAPVTLLMGCKSSGVKLYDHYVDGRVEESEPEIRVIYETTPCFFAQEMDCTNFYIPLSIDPIYPPEVSFQVNFNERYLIFNFLTIRGERLVVEKLPDEVAPILDWSEISVSIKWDEHAVQVTSESESIRIEKPKDSEKLTFWYRHGPGCSDLRRCADRFEVSKSGSKSIVHLYRYSKDRPYVDLSPSQHSPYNRCMYWFFR